MENKDVLVLCHLHQHLQAKSLGREADLTESEQAVILALNEENFSTRSIAKKVKRSLYFCIYSPTVTISEEGLPQKKCVAKDMYAVNSSACITF